MGDWQELVQSVFIGLIFAFLVAKLISTVISFREDNLRISRDKTLESTGQAPIEQADEKNEELVRRDESLSEDEDDWEGIESTELDETFSAAAAFVAATAGDRTATTTVSNDVQLQLYGLYKIATEGPCTVPQPPAFKITARAKWNTWQRLGAMPPEEAMQKYIMIVDDLFPTWAGCSSTMNKDEEPVPSSSAAKGTMGPVFSSFIHEEGSDNDLKLDAVHVCSREGDAESLLTHIENGVSVNLRDSEGRTPLHWAVDRGHQNIVEILISKGADLNAKDNEGQTPLHYAVVCEREAIAELLVKHNAECDAKDGDGSSPSDLCGLPWSFLPSAN